MYKSKNGFRIRPRKMDLQGLKNLKNRGAIIFLVIWLSLSLKMVIDIPTFVPFSVIILGLLSFGIIVLLEFKRVKDSKKQLLFFRGSNVSKCGINLTQKLIEREFLNQEDCEQIAIEIAKISTIEDSRYFEKVIKERRSKINYSELFRDESIGIVILFEYLYRFKFQKKENLEFRRFLFTELDISGVVKTSLTTYLDNVGKQFNSNQLINDLLLVADVNNTGSQDFLFNKQMFKNLGTRSYDFSYGDQKTVRLFFDDYFYEVRKAYSIWRKGV